MTTRLFRYAPTPSGFLHEGNALNFVLTWIFARREKAKIWLRIDDSDQTRVRDIYLENIFQTLEWLDLDYDFGPQGVEEHKKEHSQGLKTEYYYQELQKSYELFACECSRAQLAKESRYPSFCTYKNLDLERGLYAFRLKRDDLDFYRGTSKEFYQSVLWRRDNNPSYQWVSLIEDRDKGVTDVIRGEDLRGSGEFQKQLYAYLPKSQKKSFPKNFYHHNLLTKDNGEKLSKSQKSPPLIQNYKNKEQFFQKVISPFFNLSELASSAQEIEQESCFSPKDFIRL